MFGAKSSGASPVILPVANFTADATAVTQSNTVNFTDTSTVASGGQAITSWTWSFAGGTPTSSNSQNPSVVYNETGSFDVSLTVANPSGSDTETKTNYIYVTASSAAAFSATGGTESTVGDYTVHTFTTSGEFIVTGERELDIFLVGRGGDGGNGDIGACGVGGQGGEVLQSTYTFSSNTYGIRVGGAGSLYGTTENYSAIQLAVDNILQQADGRSTAGNSNNDGAPGGTGAGGVGGSGYPSPSNGGPGITNDWRGSTQYYAGGGGGGTTVTAQNTSGGIGGGGSGANTSGTGTQASAGTANTGGGGGGGGRSPSYNGKLGGSGIVIIRYLTNP